MWHIRIWENYHIKVLSDDVISDLKDYFSFDQEKKNKYDSMARQLVCARLIINNSLSSKTRIFLKEQKYGPWVLD